MNNVLPIHFLKRKTPSSLLGLSLEGSRLEGVVLRRHNGSLQIHQRFTAVLSLDPLTSDADLVGREILNHLEAAGVRERVCVMALPLKWAMAAHTQIPKLAEADIQGFLQIEAERGFPTDVTTLQMATSRMTSATGEQHATFVGIPRNHVERLDRVLRAARLKPVKFSLGITALQPARSTDADGVLALVIGETHVGLQITCGGGVVALRALEGAMESSSAEHVLHGDLIAREARITLGQLPADLRDSVKLVRILGQREPVQKLADEIRGRLELSGLKVELVSVYPPNELGKTIPPDTAVSGAFSLVARVLIGASDPFDFLPPKVSSWQRATAKYAPGRLRKLGVAAAAVLLVVLGLFGYQQWQLTRLRSDWFNIAGEVKELETVSSQISQYRPWFDTSYRCLTIVKELTAAFPEDGSVTAKAVEIRDMKTVTCSGNAESYAALIRTVHQLGTNNGVSDLVPQMRGKSPIQFSFEYRVNGGANETR
ncbi:MAG: hypothetical protein ACTHLW_13075 [Verrucomicrobiota bacterium]